MSNNESESQEIVVNKRYIIKEKLGEGGMGQVYLAFDKELKRTIALKEAFESTDSEVLKIAEKEAQTLANLKHTNLPIVYDYFVENNKQYIVMEYISGKNLHEIMQENPAFFTDEKNAEIMKTMLDVLEFLHNHQPPIVHRDIKPLNIKIAENGVLYLLDFGLVKNSILKGNTTLSKFFGFSENFSPLEQKSGEITSKEADIYSLCATLYYLYTKTKPSDSMKRANELSKSNPDPLKSVQIFNQNMPPRIAQMIMEGLKLHKENRPQDISILRDILTGSFTAYHENPFGESGYQQSSSFRINLNSIPPTEVQVNQPKSKRWVVYAILTVILISGFSFYLYENSIYSNNKAIIERLDKSAVDDFDAIEKEWANYEEATKKNSYFKWGIKEVEAKLNEKIFGFANNVIDNYRNGQSPVKKDENLWLRPQKLLEKIQALSPNNNEIKAKMEYLRGQKDFAFAFEKGANKQSLIESSRKHYQEAIKFNSKFGDAYFMIAQTYIYGKERNGNKGIEYLDQAMNNGFPFDKRSKAVKGDCLQDIADETVEKEFAKLKSKNINSDEEAHEFLDEIVLSLKIIREKYITAKTLYEDARGFGTVEKSLSAINNRLAKIDEGIDTVNKIHLLADVVSVTNQEDY
jgi:serine/threonine protein kinase